MLEELEIHNLGPIRSALIAPAGGMTAITGETGAGGCPWRSTIIPESRLFVKDFFEKNQTFLKMTKKREKVFCRMDGKHKKPLTHL